MSFRFVYLTFYRFVSFGYHDWEERQQAQQERIEVDKKEKMLKAVSEASVLGLQAIYISKHFFEICGHVL